MSESFDELLPKHIEFINKQHLFTVATAPNNGRVNVSPKGLDSFRILDNNTVAYLDTIGSNNETAAHLKENGRITIMFMSFSRNALIMRLYGKGEALQKNSANFKSLINLFPENAGVRQVFTVKVETVSTSCGYGVPIMEGIQTRETLNKWATSKTQEEKKQYQRQHNLKSIDGLDTGLIIED
jgi:uncharacterized protein YhbP (UPF0306 family)